VTPDDIPTSVTQLAETAPEIGGPATGIRSVSQNDMAKLLAHFWPAIEAHIREQVAQQLYDQNPDRDADFSAGVDWAIDTIRSSQ
jgi:hypothetical protein